MIVDKGFESFGRIVGCKTNLHTQTFELILKLVICSTVEMGCGNKIIASLQDVIQCDKLSRLPRRGRQSRSSAFESRNTLFEYIGSWIHQTGIDIPELFKSE